MLTTTAATAATTLGSADAAPAEIKHEFRLCMNTSTLSGHKLPLVQELELIAKTGYQGVEPWIREIDEYVKAGGTLKDLRKRIDDMGLRIESCIGFFEWIVDDDAKRGKALEEARRNFDQVAQIGGHMLAAPPMGATERDDMNLLKAAERYRALIDLGENYGVVPQVEVWGFSKTIGRLGEAALIAMESGHPKACILGDVYHFYKGGTKLEGLKMLQGKYFATLHMNDYPANPPRETINDSHRVYPGDGIAPIVEILRDLKAIGFQGPLSLELFNRDYWKQDAATVAKTGLAKMKAVLAKV
jgi:sugar phosphate isomerase/epimerase